MMDYKAYFIPVNPFKKALNDPFGLLRVLVLLNIVLQLYESDLALLFLSEFSIYHKAMKKSDTMCFKFGITQQSKKDSDSFWMWQADLSSAVVKKIAKICSISPSAITILLTKTLAKNVVSVFSSYSAGFYLKIVINCLVIFITMCFILLFSVTARSQTIVTDESTCRWKWDL